MIGGAAAAVSSAYNIAANWADKRVGLYFPRGRPLGGHHPRVWEAIRRKLLERGVELHPRHRAIVPVGFACDRTTDDVVTWSGGQTRTTADTALWTIGRVLPNTRSLPSEILDDAGFVQTTSYLRVPGRLCDRRRGRDRRATQLRTQSRRPDNRTQHTRRFRRRRGQGIRAPGASLGLGPRCSTGRAGCVRSTRGAALNSRVAIRACGQARVRAAGNLPRYSATPDTWVRPGGAGANMNPWRKTPRAERCGVAKTRFPPGTDTWRVCPEAAMGAW